MRAHPAASTSWTTPLGLTLLALTCAPAMLGAQRQCEGGAVRLETGTGVLEGTLTCPAGAGPWPVALLVPGAGRVDRDGNSSMQANHMDTFALLADGLAARGVAVVRYDKRGVGASRSAAPKDRLPRFVTFAQDAALWVQRLQVDDRFTSVTVIGHGEGALAGMLAARAADADAFVSLAGQGRPGAELISEQFSTRLPMELRASFRQVLAHLSAGATDDEVPYELAGLLGPDAQAYLASWFRFDPAVEIGRLEVPVLIVQGTADAQATLRDAQLLNAGLPRADAIMIDGVDHALRHVVAEDEHSRSRRARPPLDEGVLEGVAAFVAQVRRR